MRMPCATLALWIVAAGGGRTAVAADKAAEPGGPLLRIVKEGLEAREASFRSLKFHVEYQGRTRSMPGAPARERVEVVDAVVDANQRVKLDELTSPLGAKPGKDGRVPMIHNIAAYTAEGTRAVSWPADGKSTYALLRKGYGIMWMTHPLWILRLNQYNLTREVGDPKLATFEGVETVLGQRTIRVSTRWEVAGFPGSETHQTYWFGPDLGYALVRAMREWRPDRATPPRQYEWVECEGFVREGSLWLPTKVVHEESDSANGTFDYILQFTAKFSNWVVNPPLDDKDFAVEVPPGSIVTDGDKNLSYIKGSFYDPATKGHAEQARKSGAGKVAIPPPNLPGPDAVEHFQKLARENPYTKPAPDDVPTTAPPPR